MTYKYATNYGRIGTARSANLQAYYKFDGDLTDSSGNGFTLSVNTGTEAYTSIPYGGLKRYAPDLAIQGFKFDGSTRLEKSAETEFQITGAFSMHMLLVFDMIDPVFDWILTYGDNVSDSGANSPATNYLYSLALTSSKYRSLTEHGGAGAGTNSWWEVVNCPPVIGQPVFLTQTRDASGNYNFYSDGVSMGVSAVENYPTAPTGGDSVNSVLAIGNQDANTDPNAFFPGAMAELQILNIELTPAQVLEDATKVMPWL